eukprot:jgi/Bigna1/74466/fgenesh1_pg.29_\
MAKKIGAAAGGKKKSSLKKLVAAAKKALEDGKYAQVSKRLSEGLQSREGVKDETLYSALVYSAIAFMELGALADARTQLQDAVGIFPDKLRAWKNMVEVHSRMISSDGGSKPAWKERVQALEQYWQCTKKKGGGRHAQATLSLASACLEGQDYMKAREVLNDGTGLFTENGEEDVKEGDRFLFVLYTTLAGLGIYDNELTKEVEEETVRRQRRGKSEEKARESARFELEEKRLSVPTVEELTKKALDAASSLSLLLSDENIAILEQLRARRLSRLVAKIRVAEKKALDGGGDFLVLRSLRKSLAEECEAMRRAHPTCPLPLETLVEFCTDFGSGVGSDGSYAEDHLRKARRVLARLAHSFPLQSRNGWFGLGFLLPQIEMIRVLRAQQCRHSQEQQRQQQQQQQQPNSVKNNSLRQARIMINADVLLAHYQEQDGGKIQFFTKHDDAKGKGGHKNPNDKNGGSGSSSNTGHGSSKNGTSSYSVAQLAAFSGRAYIAALRRKSRSAVALVRQGLQLWKLMTAAKKSGNGGAVASKKSSAVSPPPLPPPPRLFESLKHWLELALATAYRNEGPTRRDKAKTLLKRIVRKEEEERKGLGGGGGSDDTGSSGSGTRRADVIPIMLALRARHEQAQCDVEEAETALEKGDAETFDRAIQGATSKCEAAASIYPWSDWPASLLSRVFLLKWRALSTASFPVAAAAVDGETQKEGGGGGGKAGQYLRLGIESAQRALSSEPSGAMHYLRLGQLYRAKGGHEWTDKKFAFEALLHAAKLDPTLATPFALIGLYYQSVSADTRRAKKCFQKALGLFPGNREAGEALAHIYLKSGQYTLLKEMLTRATDSDPTAKWAWLLRARVLMRKHQQQLPGGEQGGTSQLHVAASCLQSALRCDPSDAQAWEEIGHVYSTQGKLTAAAKAFTRAITLSSGGAHDEKKQDGEEKKGGGGGRGRGGIELLSSSFSSSPLSFSTAVRLYQLSDVHMRMGLMTEAVTSLKLLAADFKEKRRRGEDGKMKEEEKQQLERMKWFGVCVGQLLSQALLIRAEHLASEGAYIAAGGMLTEGLQTLEDMCSGPEAATSIRLAKLKVDILSLQSSLAHSSPSKSFSPLQYVEKALAINKDARTAYRRGGEDDDGDDARNSSFGKQHLNMLLLDAAMLHIRASRILKQQKQQQQQQQQQQHLSAALGHLKTVLTDTRKSRQQEETAWQLAMMVCCRREEEDGFAKLESHEYFTAMRQHYLSKAIQANPSKGVAWVNLALIYLQHSSNSSTGTHHQIPKEEGGSGGGGGDSQHQWRQQQCASLARLALVRGQSLEPDKQELWLAQGLANLQLMPENMRGEERLDSLSLAHAAFKQAREMATEAGKLASASAWLGEALTSYCMHRLCALHHHTTSSKPAITSTIAAISAAATTATNSWSSSSTSSTSSSNNNNNNNNNNSPGGFLISAVRAASKRLELSPFDPGAEVLLGCCCELSNNLTAAKACFERAQELAGIDSMGGTTPAAAAATAKTQQYYGSSERAMAACNLARVLLMLEDRDKKTRTREAGAAKTSQILDLLNKAEGVLCGKKGEEEVRGTAIREIIFRLKALNALRACSGCNGDAATSDGDHASAASAAVKACEDLLKYRQLLLERKQEGNCEESSSLPSSVWWSLDRRLLSIAHLYSNNWKAALAEAMKVRKLHAHALALALALAHAHAHAHALLAFPLFREQKAVLPPSVYTSACVHTFALLLQHALRARGSLDAPRSVEKGKGDVAALLEEMIGEMRESEGPPFASAHTCSLWLSLANDNMLKAQRLVTKLLHMQPTALAHWNTLATLLAANGEGYGQGDEFACRQRCQARLTRRRLRARACIEGGGGLANSSMGVRVACSAVVDDPTRRDAWEGVFYGVALRALRHGSRSRLLQAARFLTQKHLPCTTEISLLTLRALACRCCLLAGDYTQAREHLHHLKARIPEAVAAKARGGANTLEALSLLEEAHLHLLHGGGGRGSSTQGPGGEKEEEEEGMGEGTPASSSATSSWVIAKEALACYHQAIRKLPSDIHVWEELSLVYSAAGALEAAEKCLEAALTVLQPTSHAGDATGDDAKGRGGRGGDVFAEARIQLRLATMAFFTRRYVAGTQRAARACFLTPRSPAAHFLHGLFLRKTRKFDEALVAFKTAFDLRASQKYAAAAAGVTSLDDDGFCYDYGQQDSATSVASAQNMGLQDLSLASLNLFAVHFRRKAYAQAVENLDRERMLCPTIGAIYYQLGVVAGKIQKKGGHLQDLEDRLKDIVSRNPASYFQKAIRLNPKAEVYWNALAKCKTKV